jgi:hypothetical protein
MQAKSIGRDAACDLVIEDTSVASRHAWAEMTGEGFIYVTRDAADRALSLRRNGHWINVERVSLCVDDRLRIGAHDIPLARLSGLFGAAAGARLRPRPTGPLPPRRGKPDPTTDGGSGPGPRRNPVTGKIDD